MAVNTAKVADRRKLAYTSLGEVLADAEQLSAGPVTLLGNWSPGQVFRHLAIAYDGSIDGLTMTFPWYLRMMAKMFKNKLVNMPMPPGIKFLRGCARATMPEPTSTEEGLAELRAAVAPGKRSASCPAPGVRRVDK